MAQSLNVIALISGGKDSLFSILHCQANGHRVVALANLHPGPLANGEEQDIDSYMYQTVGHSVVPLYSQALDLPLYRRQITGTAVDSNRDYAAPLRSLSSSSSSQQTQSQKQKIDVEEEQGIVEQEDETEDLVPLLKRVMQAHPTANAISTGAILSTYQRTRVESVALRLGLTPLAYLWQYPQLPPYEQSALLRDMRAVGQQAIIIKTASGGLDASFLGLDVAGGPAAVARLSKAMGMFGDEVGAGAILGEGGEFETLAVDGPGPVWKKKIRVDGEAVVLEGGQTVFKVVKSWVEDKKNGEGDVGALRVPDVFDDEFAKLLESIEDTKTDVVVPESTTIPSSSSSSPTTPAPLLPTNTIRSTPTLLTISNLTSPTPSSSPSHQLSSILLLLSHHLSTHHVPKSNITHTTLLLRSMSTFTLLNPLYASFFTAINPPSRVTVACSTAMPHGTDVMLSIIASRSAKREGLHVQSTSYWAPANIGPYSQAISIPLPPPAISSPPPSADPEDAHGDAEEEGQKEVGSTVYIAGQIPLHPASMAPYTSRAFPGQVALSLQHLWRIAAVKQLTWWCGAAVAYIPSSITHSLSSIHTIQKAWRHIHTSSHHAQASESESHHHEEQDHVDPWDALNIHSSSPSSFSDKIPRPRIPDYTALHPTAASADALPIPPCFVAQISSLPRGVDVEWSATGLTCSGIRFEREPGMTVVTVQGSRARFVTLELRGEHDVRGLAAREWTAGTLYVSRDSALGERLGGVVAKGGVQWVPCERVWGEQGNEVGAVFVGRVDE
ncbi:ATP binding L-PSP endoribonuclease family protein-like protein [Bipolaris maydis]|nr:ATP binding L-PSP endoribonuclease family protein-like protein [Bipolaris maydis]